MNWLSLTISNVLTASQPPSAQTREDSSHSGTQLLAQSGNTYQAWSTSCSTDQVKFYRNCWLMVECQHCIWDDGDPLKSKSRRTYCTKDQVLKCHRSIDCLEICSLLATRIYNGFYDFSSCYVIGMDSEVGVKRGCSQPVLQLWWPVTGCIHSFLW